MAKSVESELKSAKVASNRVAALELKIKELSEAKSQLELKRAAVDKEAADLRKRCGLLETRLGRQGTRRDATELRGELEKLKYVHEADLDKAEHEKLMVLRGKYEGPPPDSRSPLSGRR